MPSADARPPRPEPAGRISPPLGRMARASPLSTLSKANPPVRRREPVDSGSDPLSPSSAADRSPLDGWASGLPTTTRDGPASPANGDRPRPLSGLLFTRARGDPLETCRDVPGACVGDASVAAPESGNPLGEPVRTREGRINRSSRKEVTASLLCSAVTECCTAQAKSCIEWRRPEPAERWAYGLPDTGAPTAVRQPDRAAPGAGTAARRCGPVAGARRLRPLSARPWCRAASFA